VGVPVTQGILGPAACRGTSGYAHFMAFKLSSITVQAPSAASPEVPIPEDEEYYSSWSLFLVCLLLIVSLWTSYYLQIRKIRAIHETTVSIFAGMFVGLVVRLAPGTMIREMLVSIPSLLLCTAFTNIMVYCFTGACLLVNRDYCG
jgi:hypothetical protein